MTFRRGSRPSCGTAPRPETPACTRSRWRVIAAPMLSSDDRLPDRGAAAVADGYLALLAVPVETPRHEAGGLGWRVLGPRSGSSARTIWSWPPPGRCDARRPRAQRALRGRAQRARSRAAAHPHRAAAHHRARPGCGLRRGRAAGAGAGERRRVRDPRRRGRRAHRQRGRRPRRRGRDRLAKSGGSLAVGRRAAEYRLPPVALENAGSDLRLRELDPMLDAGHAAYVGVPLAGVRKGRPSACSPCMRCSPGHGVRKRSRRCRARCRSTSAALSNAELYQRVALEKERSFAVSGQHRRRHRRGTGIHARGPGRPVEPGGGEDHRRFGGGCPRQGARRDDPELARVGQRRPGGDRHPFWIMRGREEVWLSVTEAGDARSGAGQAVAGRIFAFRDIWSAVSSSR